VPSNTLRDFLCSGPQVYAIILSRFPRLSKWITQELPPWHQCDRQQQTYYIRWDMSILYKTLISIKELMK